MCFLLYVFKLVPLVQVCELDIIFNFEKAYYILDEFILGGEAQETSKKIVLKAIEQADLLQEVRENFFVMQKLYWYCIFFILLYPENSCFRSVYLNYY